MAAGDDSSVPLASPTGNADTRLTASGDHRQVVALGNPGDRVVSVEPGNRLNVNLGPNTWFADPWAGSALDTTDRWTLSNGTSPTISLGNMTMSATVSTYNAIRSKPVMPYNLGYQYIANGIQLEAAAATGAGRFWGLGTPATTPAAAVLAQDGIGFEIDQATGNLLAVTYAAGVRTTVATLTRPSDGAIHRYAVHWRPTEAFWYIDGLDVPAASVSFPNVQIQELPLLIVRQNAASFTGTPTFVNIGVAAGDTSRMGEPLVDGTFPFRRAQVSANGALAISGGSAGTTTGAIAAAGTGTVGPLNVATAGNCTFVIRNTTAASAWAGAPVVVFEQSGDNTSWSPLFVVRADTGQVGSTWTLGPGIANGELMFDAALEGVTYVRARVTTGPTTNGLTIDINAGGMPFSQGTTSLAVPLDSHKATYVGVPNGTSGVFTPHVVTTGPFLKLTNPAGSGRAFRVVRARVELTIATAAMLTVAMSKQTAVSTGGTSAAGAIARMDEGDAATVATIEQYTATPSAGTNVYLAQRRLWVGVATAAGAPTVLELPFGSGKPTKALVLRPGQAAAFLWLAAPATAVTAGYEFEWIEEPV